MKDRHSFSVLLVRSCVYFVREVLPFYECDYFIATAIAAIPLIILFDRCNMGKTSTSTAPRIHHGEKIGTIGILVPRKRKEKGSVAPKFFIRFL